MQIQNQERQIAIWLVEDNLTAQQNLISVFAGSATATVTKTFITCEEAFKELKEGSVFPNVIFLDVFLPGINGLEGIAVFKHLIPTTKIIVFTLSEDDDTALSAMIQGADGFVCKTRTIDMHQAVHTVMAGSVIMDQHVAKQIFRYFGKPHLAIQPWNLSRREVEILDMLAKGETAKVIAQSLSLSPFTVQDHIKHIYEKLHVHSRSEALREYFNSIPSFKELLGNHLKK